MVISCMENDLFPIRVNKEVAIVRANGAVTVDGFEVCKRGDKECACSSYRLTAPHWQLAQ
jgi:hypothetical protein